MAALASGDAGARALLDRACEAGETEGCLELGRAFASGKGGPADPTKARDTFAKTCTGPAYSIEGCGLFVRASRAADEGVDVATLVKPAKIGCSVTGANEKNREVRADACAVLGEALQKSGQDEMGATRAFRDACKLGSVAGCDAVKQAETAKAEEKAARGADDVEGANLNMAGMNVDGLVLTDISCKTEGGGLGGLFGGIAIGAGFKARKAQLDACSSKGMAETRVKWAGSGGRMTNIHASGKDAAVNKCVERALSGAVATTTGICAATVKHGRR